MPKTRNNIVSQQAVDNQFRKVLDEKMLSTLSGTTTEAENAFMKSSSRYQGTPIHVKSANRIIFKKKLIQSPQKLTPIDTNSKLAPLCSQSKPNLEPACPSISATPSPQKMLSP